MSSLVIVRHLPGKHDQSTHGRGGLGEAQLEALAPASSWSADRQGAAVSALRETEDGKVLADTLDKWQDGGSIGRVRSAVDKYVKGEDQNPTSQKRAEVLTDAIRSVPKGYAPPVLHRGLNISGSQANVLKKFNAGDTVDLNVTSFTSDKAVATKFQKMTGGSGKTRVRMELIGDDTKALPIQNLARDKRLFPEKEWITGGRFKVVEAKKGPSGDVIVKIKQEAVIGE